MRHRRDNRDDGPGDDPTVLARRAARGDRAAANRFVAITATDVRRLCAHLVDADSADDLVQATYERALPALPRFRGDASARTWLLTIARRTCYDEIRTRVRRRRRDAELFRAAEYAVSDPGSSGALGALVDALPDGRRDAFVLTQIVGLTYDEAASVLDCPIGTIRSQVARARADLRAQITAAEHDPSTDRADVHAWS